MDFSSPELTFFKKAVQTHSTKNSIELLRSHKSLTEIPLYKLFCYFFCVFYKNEEIFSFLLKSDNPLDPPLLKKVNSNKKEAWIALFERLIYRTEFS